MPYDERLVRLAARGIALWDVVGEAQREGSLDGAIRGATPNQLARLSSRPIRGSGRSRSMARPLRAWAGAALAGLGDSS